MKLEYLYLLGVASACIYPHPSDCDTVSCVEGGGVCGKVVSVYTSDGRRRLEEGEGSGKEDSESKDTTVD